MAVEIRLVITEPQSINISSQILSGNWNVSLHCFRYGNDHFSWVLEMEEHHSCITLEGNDDFCLIPEWEENLACITLDENSHICSLLECEELLTCLTVDIHNNFNSILECEDNLTICTLGGNNEYHTIRQWKDHLTCLTVDRKWDLSSLVRLQMGIIISASCLRMEIDSGVAGTQNGSGIGTYRGPGWKIQCDSDSDGCEWSGPSSTHEQKNVQSFGNLTSPNWNLGTWLPWFKFCTIRFNQSSYGSGTAQKLT